MATTIETPPEDTTSSRSGKSAIHLPPALDSSHALAAVEEFWHRSVPRRLIAAQRSDADGEAWNEWRRHIADRKAPKLPKPVQSMPRPLLWGLSAAEGNAPFAESLGTLAKCTKSVSDAEELLSEWLAGAHNRTVSITSALEHVAIAAELPKLAATTSDTLWWGLCDCLYSVAVDAARSAPDWEHDPAEVVAHQLLAGELALWLAWGFPEITPLRGLRKSAHGVFSEAIVELLDGEGIPHGCYLPWWRPLFACWTRAALVGSQLKKGCWSSDAQTQYEWALRQTIRTSRPDGSIMLSDGDQREWSAELFATALDLAGDDADFAAADAVLPGRVVPADAEFDDDDLPTPSVNSEWAGLAVLATRWSKAAPRITLTYDQQPMQIEIAVGRDVVCRGAWEFELVCDGKPVGFDDDWDEQCWQTDDDCDFLELALEMDNGLRLERQLLLGREDTVLYLADYVLSDDDRAREFEYRLHLPLVENVQFEAETGTRDGLLVADKPLAAVFPPALAEWRTDSRGGELTSDGKRLTVTRRHQGQRFCCPLFFDFKPRRLTKERTWRQLTVAEQLEVQSTDVAIGFRMQSGNDQWLIYRSLAPAANRTVIGQNISSEFFAGRFLPTGEVDELIEIESGDIESGDIEPGDVDE